MNVREHLERVIGDALRAAGAPADAPAAVKQSGRPEFGHYQANGVMSAAKRLSRNPRELAAQVAEGLDLSDIAEKVEVAGPGFINIHLSRGFLASSLKARLADARLGIELHTAQTVVVDYSAPNLAKEMHIGHLRGTTIGDALVRILEFLGHRVIRANHMGDWGSQFGRLLAYMEMHNETLTTELADLERFYQAATRLYEEDETFRARARERVVQLQNGDPECLELWHRFIAESIHHCQQIYESLNITLRPEDVAGESFYRDALPTVVAELEEMGLATESEGALCVFLDQFKGKDGKPLPAIIRATSGAYPYITTDLAAVRYRTRTLEADRALYFVDARQSLHLQQLFAIAHAAGYLTERHDFRHLPNGTIMGDDGKPFKTRSGDLVKLADVIAEARERARVLVDDKSPQLSEEERAEIARVVGVGALKYGELVKNRTSDYVFNWDNMLSFEGNTAPYLLYAYTRIRSIFRRAGVDAGASAGDIRITEEPEKKLAIKLLQFAEVIDLVVEECLPNLLCNYLFELAGLFMSFYESCPVLRSDAVTQTSRLLLCQLTATTLAKGLDLLGIETVDQM